jgi:hypothetical protein
MAEFTQQQKAIIGSKNRHNLVNSVWKTGKTAVLTRIYLNGQEKPGTPQAIYLTPNALATRCVIEHLQRITSLDWGQELVGTVSELGVKLLQKLHRELGYARPPGVISDMAASADRTAARRSALAIHADSSSPAFFEQWDRHYLQQLRQKSLATPRSARVELQNLFKLSHPAVSGVKLLLADNVHDFTLEELLVLASMQARMTQSAIAGNTNLAIYDRPQNLDPENWVTLASLDGFKPHSLTQVFGFGASLGLFLQQLGAYNSKRVYENSLTFLGDSPGQGLVEVNVSSHQHMLDTILETEAQLQLGMRGRLLLVVLRNVNDARHLAGELKKPAFLMWDKHRLWLKPEVPEKGIICTTPYEVPYLHPDYVVVPNCFDGYWPYRKERNSENCRRLFMRAIASARRGIYFLVPDRNHGLLSSPFLSEGCTPKLAITPSADIVK